MKTILMHVFIGNFSIAKILTCKIKINIKYVQFELETIKIESRIVFTLMVLILDHRAKCRQLGNAVID
jgi:hypothetical protein